MKADFQNKMVVDLKKISRKDKENDRREKFSIVKKSGKLFFHRFFLIGLGVILGIAFVFWSFLFREEEKNESFFQTPASLNREIYQLPGKTIPGGLNLVFYADDYSSREEFNTDVDFLMQNIQKVEPWKSYGRFNVYKILPSKKENLCQVKTENERKPALRCEVKINQYFEKMELSRAKFIVLSRKDFQSWANVSRLENAGIFFSLPQKLEATTAGANSYLMLHLLGHAFGLKDEEKFIIAKAEGQPHTPNGPNCAPDKTTAEKWWGDLAQKYPNRVGYFNTCAGSDEYIRPTESSLMNFGQMEKFVPDYGPVSERYLRKILDYCFLENQPDLEKDPEFFQQYPEFKACLQ